MCKLTCIICNVWDEWSFKNDHFSYMLSTACIIELGKIELFIRSEIQSVRFFIVIPQKTFKIDENVLTLKDNDSTVNLLGGTRECTLWNIKKRQAQPQNFRCRSPKEWFILGSQLERLIDPIFFYIYNTGSHDLPAIWRQCYQILKCVTAWFAWKRQNK